MDSGVVTVVNKSVEISRGSEPEYHLDFSAIRNLLVFNVDGESVKVGDLYKHKKTILVLVRHFLCYACKEYVDDLALVPVKYFKDADVNLVVIGCSLPKFIKPFRSATGYSQTLYVDPERNLYKALGCSEKVRDFSTATVKESKHVKSGFLSGILKSTFRGMRYREMQGDAKQQGGAFIIGPGDVVDYAHRDWVAVDHTPINDLLAIAGVELVNFERDTRVLTL